MHASHAPHRTARDETEDHRDVPHPADDAGQLLVCCALAALHLGRRDQQRAALDGVPVQVIHVSNVHGSDPLHPRCVPVLERLWQQAHGDVVVAREVGRRREAFWDRWGDVSEQALSNVL